MKDKQQDFLRLSSSLPLNGLYGLAQKLYRTFIPLSLRAQRVFRICVPPELDRKLRTFSPYYQGEFKNCRAFRRFLRQTLDGAGHYNFKGVCLPAGFDAAMYKTETFALFCNTFMFWYFLNDDYDSRLVGEFDPYMPEGPYGYTHADFDVTVKAGDTVLDAGAFIGDFSAYAAAKGARCYAFEPLPALFAQLNQTAQMNNGANIIPVQCGLGDRTGECDILNAGSNSKLMPPPSAGTNVYTKEDNAYTAENSNDRVERIRMTTVDQFAADNHLARVDFIKADIEGAERLMLRGAQRTLREFAPKLAICTYHLNDDPEVLRECILRANPAYRIIQRAHKLYACV